MGAGRPSLVPPGHRSLPPGARPLPSTPHQLLALRLGFLVQRFFQRKATCAAVDSRDWGPTHSCRTGKSCRPCPLTRTADPGFETGHVPAPTPGPRALSAQGTAQGPSSVSVGPWVTDWPCSPTGQLEAHCLDRLGLTDSHDSSPSKATRPTADSGARGRLPGPSLGSGAKGPCGSCR